MSPVFVGLYVNVQPPGYEFLVRHWHPSEIHGESQVASFTDEPFVWCFCMPHMDATVKKPGVKERGR